jgi:CRISPR-associated endonuclease Csn1
MHGHWKYLLDKGFISYKKYERLTRTTPLTDEELADFINRQLVETRQSTKVVASLLKQLYADTTIVYVKGKNVSDFRNREDCKYGVKVRDMNDYHHAKDAYLNIVVGNVYYTKFTSNPLKWLKNNKGVKYNLKRMYDWDIKDGNNSVWIAGKNGTQSVVDKTLAKNDILFTRLAVCDKGMLFKVTPKSKNEKTDKLIPLKKGMDTHKYGGYTGVQSAYFMLVESKDERGKLKRSIENVPLYKINEFKDNDKALIDYCVEVYGLNEPRIIIPVIKKNSKIVIDGFPMYLTGNDGKRLEVHCAVQLCLDIEYQLYLKRVTKYVDENTKRPDKNKLLMINAHHGITREENIKLYDVFVDKLTNSIYKHRPANPKDVLIEKREKFLALSLEEQCIVLNEILNLFQCNAKTANLTLIGGNKTTGRTRVSNTITGKNSVKLVHQSVDGIFEYTIDLLKI